MRITIKMDVYDDDGMLTDASDSTGLTKQGHEWIMEALMRYGEDINITKDVDQR